MTITWDSIIELAKVLGALGTIGTILYAIIKWFQRQERQSVDIEDLHKLHSSDMKSVQAELCVLSYAMLAALDGLKQLHCNGNVTKAYEALEKHLNQKAHETPNQ